MVWIVCAGASTRFGRVAFACLVSASAIAKWHSGLSKISIECSNLF